MVVALLVLKILGKAQLKKLEAKVEELENDLELLNSGISSKDKKIKDLILKDKDSQTAIDQLQVKGKYFSEFTNYLLTMTLLVEQQQQENKKLKGEYS